MCADSVKPLTFRSLKARCMHWSMVLCLGMSAAYALPARAHSDGLSEASALSALPMAMSVSAPVMSVAAGSVLVLASVEVVAEGTVWVLQRASDGARLVVKWSAISAGMASVAVGTVVTVTAMSAGWVLSTAGTVLAMIPNALGQALLHHERVIR